jgi:hypothetical protein
MDDHSGLIIRKHKFRFELDGAVVRPIEKEEGYFVFLEPVPEYAELKITSGTYHTSTIRIVKETTDKQIALHEVRLYVKPGGRYCGGSSFHNGKIESQGPVFPIVVGVKSSKSTNLLFSKICEKEDKSYLSCKELLNNTMHVLSVGKTYCITTKKQTDILIILKRTDTHEYLIEGNISPDHSPGTPIERIYRSITDENGYYSIPLSADETDNPMDVLTL